MAGFYRITKEGDILLQVKVQPKASRNQVEGLQGDALKVRITAPPSRGAANSQCLRLLAQWLGISPSRLDIVKGTKERNKTVLVKEISEDQFVQILREKGLID